MVIHFLSVRLAIVDAIKVKEAEEKAMGWTLPSCHLATLRQLAEALDRGESVEVRYS